MLDPLHPFDLSLDAAVCSKIANLDRVKPLTELCVDAYDDSSFPVDSLPQFHNLFSLVQHLHESQGNELRRLSKRSWMKIPLEEPMRSPRH